jgi:rubrerythrin
MGRELLQDIVRSQTFSLQGRQLAEADDLEELIAQSIEFEQDTIDFYEFLASFLDDPRAVEQMRRIIDQEREHVRQLEAVRAEGAPPEMGNA